MRRRPAALSRAAGHPPTNQRIVPWRKPDRAERPQSNREMDATRRQRRRRIWLTNYRKGNVMSGINASNSNPATASSELPSEIWRWDATDIAAHIRLRTITSSDAVQSCLDRIAEVNPHLNAVVHMVADNALREAKEADAALKNNAPIDRLSRQGKTGSDRHTVRMALLTQMYGPAVRCKRFRQPGRCGLASMYPASDWSVLCSGPSWISARVRSH